MLVSIEPDSVPVTPVSSPEKVNALLQVVTTRTLEHSAAAESPALVLSKLLKGKTLEVRRHRLEIPLKIVRRWFNKRKHLA